MVKSSYSKLQPGQTLIMMSFAKNNVVECMEWILIRYEC